MLFCEDIFVFARAGIVELHDLLVSATLSQMSCSQGRQAFPTWHDLANHGATAAARHENGALPATGGRLQ